MKRRAGSAVFANPVLVGAVTVLVIIVAVFLAYNANAGLPFVPTYEFNAKVPNGAQLVVGNEVREGGYRVGVVSEINPVVLQDGTNGAELVMKLDGGVGPLPADSAIEVRPRSALGLKYVELQRGSSRDTLPEGSTITVGEAALAPELQQFFNLFDKKTRDNVAVNLGEYGNGLAYRGASLNEAFADLPRLLKSLPPLMITLRDPATRLVPFFGELEDAARVSSPLANTIADGFRAGAQTFGAIASDPRALHETIQESPPTLAVGTIALRNSRPFLHSLANISSDLRGAAAELRISVPPINAALQAGISPLRQSPVLNANLTDNFMALTALARSPGSDRGVAGLQETMGTLRPLTRFLGPYVTVCNYWNYSWTYLSDHISDRDQTGEIERIRAKMSSGDQMPLGSYGQGEPVPTLHAQAYGAAIDANGNADCETGQRGFPNHLARGFPAGFPLVADPQTPGDQGPTFTGRARVPAGETFSATAEGGGNLRP
ncbi:MAG: phospholipid/cholesterol/gamma-HCH transport system substrate-binding protein [Solirubrobacteraceae bacterium]|nr:phospholipid/cholesterol/gamma-HCH transport system substrate-binding protein [Solirubrobacteraceae bacterium]